MDHPPKDLPGALLEAAPTFSEIRPRCLAGFVSFLHHRFARERTMRHARSSVLTKPSVGSRFFHSAKEPGEACHGSATPATVRHLGDASSFPPAVSFVRPPLRLRVAVPAAAGTHQAAPRAPPAGAPPCPPPAHPVEVVCHSDLSRVDLHNFLLRGQPFVAVDGPLECLLPGAIPMLQAPAQFLMQSWVLGSFQSRTGAFSVAFLLRSSSRRGEGPQVAGLERGCHPLVHWLDQRGDTGGRRPALLWG